MTNSFRINNGDLSKHVEKLSEQVTSVNVSLEERAQRVDLEVERKRIDTFVSLPNGSTTGDAELIDGRVLSDGSVYSNIGGSIRAVDKDLKLVKTVLPCNVELINKTDLIWSQGNLDGITGNVIETNSAIYSNIISIQKDEVNNVQFSVITGYRIDVHYWDINGVYAGHTGWIISDGVIIKKTIPYPKIKIVINKQGSTISSETNQESGYTMRVMAKTTLKNIESQLGTMEDNINILSKNISDLIKGVYNINDFTANSVYTFETLKVGDIAPSTSGFSSMGNASIKITVTAGDFIKVKGAATGSAKFIAVLDTNHKIRYIVDKSIDKFFNIIIDTDGYALINGYSTYDIEIIHQGWILGSLNEYISKTQEEHYENPVYAPSPQLPANTEIDSDFNADSCTAQDIYNYLDNLSIKYPNYITKENMGKDESGILDCNRYIACKKYYNAWLKVNSPKMYAWSNGITKYYFTSCSPRVGDYAYIVPYIGAYQYIVTSVDNKNRQITINGTIVLTRVESDNVPASLVYTTIIDTAVGKDIVNKNGGSLDIKITSITNDTMIDSRGVSYTRYPIGDFGNNSPLVTIVLWANEHGGDSDPKECSIVLARMIKDLCMTKHIENKFLNFIKNYAKLIVIPCANPYGFNLNDYRGRLNYNGINLNRNYDCSGWFISNDMDKGEYGGSENEIQYIMNTIKLSDANVGVDIHCLGHTTGANDGLCHYEGRTDSVNKINQIAEVMKSEYNLSFTSYGNSLPASNAHGSSYLQQENVFGGLIEMQPREGKRGDINEELHSSLIMEANYTLLIETLYMWMVDYDSDLSMSNIR